MEELRKENAALKEEAREVENQIREFQDLKSR